MQRFRVQNPIIRLLRDETDALALFGSLATQQREVCAFAYLDPKWRLLGVRHTPSNRRDVATVPFREIVRDSLMLSARMVVMAHNHPSGELRPSNDDVHVTRRLARALDAIEVRLVDHLIITRDGSTSIRRQAML